MLVLFVSNGSAVVEYANAANCFLNAPRCLHSSLAIYGNVYGVNLEGPLCDGTCNKLLTRRMVITTEPTAVLVLYRLFVTSCMLSLGCSAAADTVECSACAPLDGQCPPGFVVSGDCNCVCGSEGNVLPIDRCDHLSCRSYLRSGYWAGYVRHPAGTNGSRLELYTEKCPSGFCESGSAPLLLPGLSNLSNLTEDLNQVVCGMTRKGLLCGECSPGFGPARGEPLPRLLLVCTVPPTL